MRWVRIETRVFFSLFFSFFPFLRPRRSHNSPPSRKIWEWRSSAIFKCRSSVVRLTWEIDSWRRELLTKRTAIEIPRHVRHFEDQCQDRGKKKKKKTDAWVSLPTFFEMKKRPLQYAIRMLPVYLSPPFSCPFLCHCLPNRGSLWLYRRRGIARGVLWAGFVECVTTRS